MIRIIENVVPHRTVDAGKLGWLSGRRALTRQNFPANREYVDLRGFSRADIDVALKEEAEGYQYLKAAQHSDKSIEDVDTWFAQTSIVRVVDFGVGAAVVALSALGGVPVTSCRGRTLGARPHQHPAPMVVFYARPAHLEMLLAAVEQSTTNIVNNGGKLELYCEDVRKMGLFALKLRDQIDG